MSANSVDSHLAGTADQLMRRVLHELESLRAYAARDAEQVAQLREGARTTRADAERAARAHVDAFSPNDLGKELHAALAADWPSDALPGSQEVGALPSSFDVARNEWQQTAASLEADVDALRATKATWDAKTFKLRRSMPSVPAAMWRATERLSQIHAALPRLREQFVVERLGSLSHLDEEVAVEVEKRQVALRKAYDAARDALNKIEHSIDLAASQWASTGWAAASPATTLQRAIRIGEFEPQLPRSADIPAVPALIEFPLRAGLAITADVDHRHEAVDLIRSTMLRALAATPPGDLRFVIFDPVSLGQSVAEFRHLSEFDQRLVDVKTWTSERDIEARLSELTDHLEVVISTYLRGQYESIDDYNLQAGEVAEPYRMLVVFDYPNGFTARAARQLLSLIENGPRCGVQTVVAIDPTQGPRDEITTSRLTHSMCTVEMVGPRRRVKLGEPIGAVDLDFLPDATPPITFDSDGRSLTPYAQLLLNIGGSSRKAQSGPVTLERVMPILSRLIASGRSEQLPSVGDPGRGIDAADPGTWWSATTAPSACAPIGRSGANDLATLFFSSTEIAGGAIVVGLPRSGKSTALHAAILSLSMIYSPRELELYLVDSKHGVEFKTYETLPHARLVSIHSEREFSTAVLQSLDKEIQRRAELMKQRTAGKANITEYRAATGEALPRIVLFMDEFHELFEDDDALGQAAFDAFSNIVRQGPFAGVHIVVASQTLSSMPAMDRGTLTLLPMRVAFMCNEADADLVMGDQNREVRALSQQGEGILNAARGESSHNQPFRGMYIPADERNKLLGKLSAKAHTEGLVRRPRVFDGDNFAPRPDHRISSGNARLDFAIGEPLSLEDTDGITLRRGRAGNILLLGASVQDDAPDRAVDAALQSCIVDAAARRMDVSVIDFIADTGEGDDTIDLKALSADMAISYRRASALHEALEDLSAEVEARRAAAEYDGAPRLLILNGLQRAFDISPEDPYAHSDDITTSKQDVARMLASVIREGPELGCHVVVVVDQLSQFEARLGRDMLKEFDWRVLGSGLRPSDIAALTESHTEPLVSRHQLLLVDHARGRRRRVRAYLPLTRTPAAQPEGSPTDVASQQRPTPPTNDHEARDR